MAEGIEKISKVRGLTSKAITPPVESEAAELARIEAGRTGEANKDHFQALMDQGRKESGAVAAVESNKDKSSLIDEVREMNYRQRPAHKGPKDLLVETENQITAIEDLKDKLKTPNLQLDSTSQFKMRNNLSHIDDSLKIALKQAGSEFAVENAEPSSAGNSTIERFLGMLTDGQHRLETLGDSLTGLSDKEISPAQMLLIQMKVNYIQQELEFFTNALNKTLEGIKTLGNVQV